MRASGAPLTVLEVPDDAVREVCGYDLLLLRPDLHVVWRGNRPPDDPGEVAGTATGYSTSTPYDRTPNGRRSTTGSRRSRSPSASPGATRIPPPRRRSGGSTTILSVATPPVGSGSVDYNEDNCRAMRVLLDALRGPPLLAE